jgi:hypothetical protein
MLLGLSKGGRSAPIVCGCRKMQNLQQQFGDLLPRCLFAFLPPKTPFPRSKRGFDASREKKDDRPNPIIANAETRDPAPDTRLFVPSCLSKKKVLCQTDPLSIWAACLCLSLCLLCPLWIKAWISLCAYVPLACYTETSASSRRWNSRMARPRTMSVFSRASSVTACRTQTRLTLRPLTRSSMASNFEKSGITQ